MVQQVQPVIHRQVEMAELVVQPALVQLPAVQVQCTLEYTAAAEEMVMVLLVMVVVVVVVLYLPVPPTVLQPLVVPGVAHWAQPLVHKTLDSVVQVVQPQQLPVQLVVARDTVGVVVDHHHLPVPVTLVQAVDQHKVVLPVVLVELVPLQLVHKDLVVLVVVYQMQVGAVVRPAVVLVQRVVMVTPV